MILCLLCIWNAQSAPDMVCVCHSTLSNRGFYLPLCSFCTSLSEDVATSLCVKCRIQQTACTKWQHSTTGHLYPGCLPSCGLTSFFPPTLHSLLYQNPLLSSHSVFYYGIDSALFKCKQDLMSFYVCSCVLVLRARVLWTWGKSGQSPALLIIPHYNGRHPQTWMTFIATLMIVRERHSCVSVPVEAHMIYQSLHIDARALVNIQ